LEVVPVTPPALTNVIGSPHSSGTAARGLLPSRPGTRQALQPVLSGQQDRTRIATVADIADQAGMLVCRGTFEPGIRRSAPA